MTEQVQVDRQVISIFNLAKSDWYFQIDNVSNNYLHSHK